MALHGLSNAEKIWNWLKAKGFNNYACAGILANLDTESGLNPRNLQDSYQVKLGLSDSEYTALVDSGVYTETQFSYDQAGYGLAQITWHSRKNKLYKYAKSRCVSIGDLEMQLEFFYMELSQNYASLLQSLLSSQSVSDAVVGVMLNYECPYDQSIAAQNVRINIGNKYYSQFAISKNEGVINMGYKYFTKGHAEKVSDHFFSTEFDCHGSGCCSKTIVNEKLIEYLEQIRVHFNAPITITSPYRCQTHNSRVGGAVGSRHEKGDACDIVVKGVTPRKVAQYAESIGILGIGLYETGKDGYFVHIDTRDYKSFWYGQSEQPRTTFGNYSGSISSSGNTANTSALDTILNFGDSGSIIKSLQEKLIKLGFSCGDAGADGDFGMATFNAVKKFQKAFNLRIDGIVGNNTLTAINGAISSLNKAEGKTVKIKADVLNVRSGAGMNYPIVSRVKHGETYAVEKVLDGWGKISNPDGWISSQYYEEV